MLSDKYITLRSVGTTIRPPMDGVKRVLDALNTRKIDHVVWDYLGLCREIPREVLANYLQQRLDLEIRNMPHTSRPSKRTIDGIRWDQCEDIQRLSGEPIMIVDRPESLSDQADELGGTSPNSAASPGSESE